jgi:cellobiose PTS system EIIB component
MTQLRVLLVCGSGASSGFMAANLRKAASAAGVDLKVTARGESEIESYVDAIDVLMVGPHLAYVLDEVDDYIGDYPVTVILMKPEYYAGLDGQQALAHLQSELAARTSA